MEKESILGARWTGLYIIGGYSLSAHKSTSRHCGNNELCEGVSRGEREQRKEEIEIQKREYGRGQTRIYDGGNGECN